MLEAIGSLAKERVTIQTLGHTDFLANRTSALVYKAQIPGYYYT